MNLFYVVILVIGGVFCITIPARLILRHGAGVIAYQPIFFFSIYFFLIHFLTPLVKHANGFYRYQIVYEDTTLLLNAILCIWLYLIAVALSQSKWMRTGIGANQQLHGSGEREALWVGLIFFLIGAIFAWRDMSIIQDVIGFEAFRSDLHGASEERGSSRTFSTLMILGSALFLAGSVSRKGSRLVYFATFAGMMLFATNYYSLLSSRNSILIMAMFNAGVWAAYARRRIGRSNRRPLQLALLVAVTVALVAGAYSLTVTRYSIGNSSYARTRLENIPLYMLDGAFGNDEALLWMFENEYELQVGTTYMAGLTNLVPSAAWPDKPLGAGPRLINMVRPGSYVRGGSNNNSLTTGLLTEGRMNFGFPGMLMALLLWAFASSRLVRAAVNANSRVTQVTLLLVALSISTVFLYAEFLGFIARVVFILAPGILAASLLGGMRRWGRRGYVQSRV